MLSKRIIIGASNNGATLAGIKSVAFDIATNWGDPTHLGIRSIEFALNSVVIPMTNTTTFTAAATTQASTLDAWQAFDTSTLKTGGSTGNAWKSNGVVTNQRLYIVFNSLQEFDEIIINNHHNSGLNNTWGTRLTKITATPDVISSTVYNNTITNAIDLGTLDFPQHLPSDVIDNQTVWTA